MPDLLKPLLLYTTMLQAKGDYIVPTLTYYLGVSFNIASLALCWRYPRRKPEVGGQLWSAVGRPGLQERCRYCCHRQILHSHVRLKRGPDFSITYPTLLQMAPLEAELAGGSLGQGQDGPSHHAAAAIAAAPARQGAGELRARSAPSPAGVSNDGSGRWRQQQLHSPATAEHGAIGADVASWRQASAATGGSSSVAAEGAPLAGGHGRHVSRQRQADMHVEELV